jgi:hypothetical protein
MTSKDDFIARLSELRLSAASEALGLSEEETRGFILKESGRLMYHLQEAVDVIHDVAPEHAVAKENLYLTSIYDDTREYFDVLSRVTDGVYSFMKSDGVDPDARDIVQHHFSEYAEILTKLSGFLSGVSLSDELDKTTEG